MPSYLPNGEINLPRLAPVDALRRSIDRAFADFTKGVGFVPTPLDAAQYDFHPDAELHDDGARTTIRIELPGVDPGDVSVQATGDQIEVAGEKKSAVESTDSGRYLSERRFGLFYRAFTKPFTVDADTIDASFDNGVLTITVPAPQQSRRTSKPIAIKTAHT